MNLTQVWKSGLAVVFACTLTFATIGCEQPAPTPAPAPEGGETEVTPAPTDGSATGAGEAVPE